MRPKFCVFVYVMFLPFNVSEDVSCVFEESCVLPCSFAPGNDPVIHWTKEDTPVYNYYKGQHQLHLQHEVYRGRTSLSDPGVQTGNASLQLHRVTVSDEGRYRCYVSTISSDNVIDTYINVRVYAPVLQVSLSQEGQQIVCTSKGIYPKPVVTWTPSTEPMTRVSPSELGLFSVFSSVALSDSESTYICNISSEFDSRSATYWENPQISFSDAEAEVTVPCTEPTAPVKSLVWKFNCETILTRRGSELVYSEFWKPFGVHLDSNNLVLKNLTRQGVFTCELSTESEEFIIITQLSKAQPPTKEEDSPRHLVIVLVSAAAVIFATGILCTLLCIRNLRRNWSRSQQTEMK